MSRIHAFPGTEPPPAPHPPEGAPPRAALSELLPAAGAEAAATAFVLSHLGRRPGPVLWIQDRLSRRESGQPYRPGLGLPGPILVLNLSHPRDALIAAEDGTRCPALSAVVVEIWGEPPALDFTATKRLALRAAASGVPCWLIRRNASAGLSAARDRWRIATLASAQDPDDPAAPGDPRWRAELFRSRDRRPGEWVVRHDRATHRLDFAAAVSDGALAEAGGEDRQRGAR